MSNNITRLDYLKLCVSSLKGITKKNWYICAFTIPLFKDHPVTDEHEELDLIVQSDGLYTLLDVEGKLELTKITDHKKDQPLFSWQETVTIDNSWLVNVKGSIETIIGRMLVNAIVFVRTCGDRIPYLNKPKFSVGDVESILIAKTKNPEELKAGDISVPEMIECIDSLNFFVFVSTFTSIAATPRTISAPPGAKEYRDKLMKEYGDSLADPVKLVEFQDKLAAFDKDYLKDDPAAQAIFGSKSRASRAKTYYFYGKGLDFIDNKGDEAIIRESLAEGGQPEPKELAKHFNDLRFASFSRGSKTAQGGYTYKILQRSISGLKVSSTPCNTKLGLPRVLDANQAKKFVGRSIRKGDSWVLIDTPDKALELVGKPIVVRSTMFCTSPGNSVCYACMSDSYKGQENATTNIASGISSVILTASLKLMHGTVTKSTEIELDDLVS